MKPLCTLFAVLLLGAPVSSALAAGTLDSIRASQTLRVGVRDSSVPFAYRLPNGEVVGYSVDICQKIVERLAKDKAIPGLKMVKVPVNAAERIPKLLSQQVDLECGSSTLTRERLLHVDFSYPIFFSYMKILSPRKIGVRGLADLKGRRVAVTAGSSGETEIRQWNSSKALGIAAIQVFPQQSESFAQLVQGRVDAFVTDDVILYGLRATLPDPDSYVVSDEKLTVEPVALMLRKNDVAFRAEVNAALKSLMSSGEIRQIYRKWFELPIPPSGKALRLPSSILLNETIRFPMDVPPAY
ncbi:amino acid ABC transporter substrate-binding protein [Niveibacterium terrae]|uniref:amino acid ABC transporter substrate-binding protein n=1 Tax=Niveibacterium terrae TaxID=3373598 RepID=UPI003A923F75